MRWVRGKHTGRNRNMRTSRSVLSLLQPHLVYYLLSFFFLFGLVLGTFFSVQADDQALERFRLLFFSSISQRISGPFYLILAASFASSFFFLLFCFLCGLSLWGFLAVPFFLLFRGYGLGLTAGFLCCAYQWQGALFHFLIILPGAFCSSLALILAGREALRASRRLLVLGEFHAKPYLMRFGFALSIALAAALADAAASACFAFLFPFS